MRTHYINTAVVSEYNKLMSSLDDSFHCILFIDNHENIIHTKKNVVTLSLIINNLTVNAFLYSETVHKELKLPYYTDNPENQDFGNMMWYNSDYPLYAIRKYFPGYDYYWSFENDVFCNGNSYKPFFNNYKKDDSDLIISDYRDVSDEKDWYWQYNTDWCFEQNRVYGCLFPVLRMSAKAVDFLYKKRLEHAKIFKKLLTNSKKNLTQEHNNLRWIFCEAFTATELTNNGFKCRSLEEPYIRYLPVYNLNVQRIFENPDFKLYHPVK